MFRSKIFAYLIVALISLVLISPVMAANGAKGPGTTAKVTNLTATAPLGNFATGAYLQVTLLNTNGVAGQSQITFPGNIDVNNGPNFYNANEIIGIQYDNVQPVGTQLGLLFYSDNSNASANYRYTFVTNKAKGGLIGQDGKSVAPLIFSMYKEMRQHVTNYRTSYGVSSYTKQPALPTVWTTWTNKASNGYDYDGYFTWLSDITDPGYTWNTVGSNGCSLVNNIGAITFDQAKMAPAKGDAQASPATKIDYGTWVQFNGPFGGWVTGNKYDNSWVHYDNPAAPQLSGSKNEAFVYLAANFLGKPIQNYRTSKLVVEVYNNP